MKAKKMILLLKDDLNSHYIVCMSKLIDLLSYFKNKLQAFL